jgi:hypothetical protein
MKYDQMNTLPQLVEEVKSHALRNYGKGGWDLVIETMSDWDIAEIVRRANNATGAIWKMSVYIKPLADHRDEIRATEW